jgi:hypothetical protein
LGPQNGTHIPIIIPFAWISVAVGALVGFFVGLIVGLFFLEFMLGSIGAIVGAPVGFLVGLSAESFFFEFIMGLNGAVVGALVGFMVGLIVGIFFFDFIIAFPVARTVCIDEINVSRTLLRGAPSSLKHLDSYLLIPVARKLRAVMSPLFKP